MSFDYLAVAEELHSGRITVAEEVAASEYREAGRGIEADLAALIAEAELASPLPDRTAEPEPSLDPNDVAAELALQGASDRELGLARRAFALKNHPDRVAPHLRHRALVRMQIANQLIDAARQRSKVDLQRRA